MLRLDATGDEAESSGDKLDISFILNSVDPRSPPTRRRRLKSPSSNLGGSLEAAAEVAIDSANAALGTSVGPSKEEKKRGRTCKAEGCNNYIVHKGLCCRHGGGKKCSIEGCNTSAKHWGLCWRHGGSTGCKIKNCTKRAKARGLCWGHGGGTKCSYARCDKVAVSEGLCWAHGGGKRCVREGCRRPGYERTLNYCVKHHTELSGSLEEQNSVSSGGGSDSDDASDEANSTRS